MIPSNGEESKGRHRGEPRFQGLTPAEQDKILRDTEPAPPPGRKRPARAEGNGKPDHEHNGDERVSANATLAAHLLERAKEARHEGLDRAAAEERLRSLNNGPARLPEAEIIHIAELAYDGPDEEYDAGQHEEYDAGQHGSAYERQPDQPEPWARPVPLSRPGDVPPFPTALLPDWLRQWVEAEAEATQTPPDLAGNLALAVVGAALARRVRVQVRPGWVEPANVYTVASLPPGDRKSAVFAAATAPVQEYEAEEQARLAPILAEMASDHRVMEMKLKTLEAKAAKAELDARTAKADPGGEGDENAGTKKDPDPRELRKQARELAKELAAHVVPDPPEFFCDDVTVEKLGQLLARQGGRMLLASAEGTCFEIAKGRYSETANFDVFLKGHAGDPLRVGRVGRVSEAVNSPALSCALAVQPDVIQGLAEQASMRGRGFLARWLYSVPVSRVGRRETAAAPVPDEVAGRFRRGMLWLWGLPEAPKGEEAGRLIPFAPGADEALRAFESWLEPQLAEDELLACLAGWGSKLAGAVARLSLILYMAGTLGTGESWGDPISRETAEAAIAIGRDYYLPHAMVAFRAMGADGRSKDAVRVVGWLRGLNRETVKLWKGVPSVSKRDIHTGVFGGSRTVDEVTAVCRLLCEHGYLRSVGPSWRKDSHLYAINPDLGETE